MRGAGAPTPRCRGPCALGSGGYGLVVSRARGSDVWRSSTLRLNPSCHSACRLQRAPRHEEGDESIEIRQRHKRHDLGKQVASRSGPSSPAPADDPLSCQPPHLPFLFPLFFYLLSSLLSLPLILSLKLGFVREEGRRPTPRRCRPTPAGHPLSSDAGPPSPLLSPFSPSHLHISLS